MSDTLVTHRPHVAAAWAPASWMPGQAGPGPMGQGPLSFGAWGPSRTTPGDPASDSQQPALAQGHALQGAPQHASAPALPAPRALAEAPSYPPVQAPPVEPAPGPVYTPRHGPAQSAAQSAPAVVVPAVSTVLPGAPSTVGTGMPPAAPSVATEKVASGIALAALAIPVAVLAAVLIWKAGYLASISSAALAALALLLYVKGAGAAPRRGRAPLVALVVLGVVLSFLACIAVDLSDFYTATAPAGAVSRTEFVTHNLVNGGVVSMYGRDALMFLLFALLGIAGTLRRVSARRSA